MIVSELAIRVKRQFGDESSVQVTDDDIIRWVNAGVSEIARKNQLLETKANSSIIAGTADYSYPTDLLTLIAVRANTVSLLKLSPSAIDDYVYDTSTPGCPTAYSTFGRIITLYPTPNAAGTLTISYTAKPAVVAETSDLFLYLRNT
jgi:hypothetical protein